MSFVRVFAVYNGVPITSSGTTELYHFHNDIILHHVMSPNLEVQVAPATSRHQHPRLSHAQRPGMSISGMKVDRNELSRLRLALFSANGKQALALPQRELMPDGPTMMWESKNMVTWKTQPSRGLC